MPTVLPVLVERQPFRVLYAEMQTARSDSGHGYGARDELVWQIARKLNKTRDDLLRSDYLVQKGGDIFRRNLTTLFAEKYPGVPIAFDDGHGLHWWVDALVVHFISQYDPELHARIFDHFAASLRPPAADAATNGHSDPYSLIIQGSQHIIALAEGHRAMQQQIQAVDQRVSDQARQLAAVQARLPPEPGRMLMREFVARRLGIQVTESQTMAWGIELSRELDRTRPGWRQPKHWDDGPKRLVNDYPVDALEAFFRHKGLLR